MKPRESAAASIARSRRRAISVCIPWLFLSAPACREAETDATSSSTASPILESTRNPFLGEWRVHGAIVRVTSDTNGVQVLSFGGPGYSEVDELSISVERHARRLVATIVKITFVNDEGIVIANPERGASQSVGDAFRLEFVEPNVLKRTILKSSLPALDQLYGNPFLCGPGPGHWSPRCGA
jgi:hypothetical protein